MVKSYGANMNFAFYTRYSAVGGILEVAGIVGSVVEHEVTEYAPL